MFASLIFLLLTFQLTANDIKLALKQLVSAKTLSYNLVHRLPDGNIERGYFQMDNNVILFEMPQRTIVVFDTLNVLFNHLNKSYSISYSNIAAAKRKLLNLESLDSYIGNFQIEQDSDNKDIVICNIKSSGNNILNSIWINKNSRHIEKLEVKYFGDDDQTIKSFVSAREIKINQKSKNQKVQVGNYLKYKNGQWVPIGKFSNYKINS